VSPVISELVNFYMNDEVGPRASRAVSRFGYPHAKGLAGSLLTWLWDNGRPSVPESRINRRVSSDMREFIQIVPGVAQLMTVSDQVLPFSNVLRFSDIVPPVEQVELARQAYATFRRHVSVTWIVPPPSGEV
jgi:hypothetical protein